MKFNMFPVIENEEARSNIVKSITRLLLFTGALPVIGGMLKFSEKHVAESVVLLMFGALWIFISYNIMRKKLVSHINILIFLAFCSLGYVLYLVFQLPAVQLMDMVVLAFLFGFIFYGLFYLRRLMNS